MQDLIFNKQFQQYATSIGISVETILNRANVFDQFLDDKLLATTSDSYRILTAFDKTVADEQLIKLSDVEQVSKFFVPLFAAKCAPNGLKPFNCHSILLMHY